MFTQTPNLPPALQRIATTPVLASEMPAGFSRFKIVRLPPEPRIHSLGAVRFDFSNSHTTESASFALFKTHAAAVQLVHIAETTKTGGLFYTKAVAVGNFAVAITSLTAAEAKTFLSLALTHLRRSER